MKIKVTNTSQAEIILSFYSIEFFAAKNTVIVHSGDYETASELLNDLKPKPPKAKKTPIQDKGKSGRPTKASQGKRCMVKLSVSITAEADDWIDEYSEHNELPSQTINRIILEHKAAYNDVVYNLEPQQANKETE